jgi:hypothetical protein
MRYSGSAGREICSERRTVSYSVVSPNGSTPGRIKNSRLNNRKEPLQSVCMTHVIRNLLILKTKYLAICVILAYKQM